MQLGHSLTHFNLTSLEVSLMDCPSSFCLLVFFYLSVSLQLRLGGDTDSSPTSSAVVKKE